MPKVTVYIPDELFERARSLPGGDNTSRVVQQGLARLLRDESPDEPLPYANRPNGADEKLLSLRKRFLAEAEREYEIGYSAAIEIAEGLPLWSLNEFSRSNFNVGSWIKPYTKAALNDIAELHRDDPIEELTHEDVAQMSADEILQRLDFVSLPTPTPEQSDWWWVWRLGGVLGTMADPLGFDHASFTPTDARVSGFADAMRDLWEAIESRDARRLELKADLDRHSREAASHVEQLQTRLQAIPHDGNNEQEGRR